MDRNDQPPAAFWRSPAGIALAVALLVLGFYLVTEHRAHLLGVLPYLLLLACPLMHVFMHRGHHGGHGASQHSGARDEQHQQ
jgi:hypothetical protein